MSGKSPGKGAARLLPVWEKGTGPRFSGALSFFAARRRKASGPSPPGQSLEAVKDGLRVFNSSVEVSRNMTRSSRPCFRNASGPSGRHRPTYARVSPAEEALPISNRRLSALTARRPGGIILELARKEPKRPAGGYFSQMLRCVPLKFAGISPGNPGGKSLLPGHSAIFQTGPGPCQKSFHSGREAFL